MLNKIRLKLLFSTFICMILLGSSCPQSENHFDVIPELEPPEFSPKKTFGIVITAFNRPEYLRQTFTSLKKSSLQDAIVVIVDDASTDPETISLIKEFDLGSIPLYKFRHRANSGVLTGLLHGFKFLFRNTQYVLNIDADVIMKRDWLIDLHRTYTKIGNPNIILTGFNTKNHPTKWCAAEWCEKESIGGINFFMSSEFYQEHFSRWFYDLNRLEHQVWKNWDWTVVDKVKESGFRLYTTKPSVMQHIGFKGLNSDPARGPTDIAEDFIE